MLYLAGGICVVCGFIFKLLPPHKINYIYGHRTKFSMKNQDTWDEAQRYSSNSLITFGLIYMVLEFLLDQFLSDFNTGYKVIIFLVGVIFMLIIDEGHLRKVFNSDGTRKV
ncbi:SdpI family protein [Clostridium sp. YIM B02505]|uniref:SdpI family protein n=1 Tax=Clostridium yunnanense TaxID=2800325 RepID=A0ABS1EUG0_9CLOT|nr:SdpI family protein [Clostridium yunnanense]MBK1813021.1 SdpI family protein [Clostridium yunnanense]